MASTVELSASVVQVLRGGDPPFDGTEFTLAGTQDPQHVSLLAHRGCPCTYLALFEELWEALKPHHLYDEHCPLWLRTLNADDDTAPPEDAELIASYTVFFGVTPTHTPSLPTTG